ncbi:hypothetical protein B0T21DRAFT_138047 [Apiosordaria backusii]|uniref:Uncharacterized protein n=1 Tax=Apiosordaria backusii TaxID=314023 RepID=A0AA40BRW1_9PEZI|nr:hypothetical protein B0T21DRAFT_138047 [Apiosordaria backusii]
MGVINTGSFCEEELGSRFRISDLDACVFVSQGLKRYREEHLPTLLCQLGTDLAPNRRSVIQEEIETLSLTDSKARLELPAVLTVSWAVGQLHVSRNGNGKNNSHTATPFTKGGTRMEKRRCSGGEVTGEVGIRSGESSRRKLCGGKESEAVQRQRDGEPRCLLRYLSYPDSTTGQGVVGRRINEGREVKPQPLTTAAPDLELTYTGLRGREPDEQGTLFPLLRWTESSGMEGSQGGFTGKTYRIWTLPPIILIHFLTEYAMELPEWRKLVSPPQVHMALYECRYWLEKGANGGALAAQAFSVRTVYVPDLRACRERFRVMVPDGIHMSTVRMLEIGVEKTLRDDEGSGRT